jgi:hypothetical protein
LHNDGAGAQQIERRAQRGLIAGCFEQHVKHTLSGAIGIERGGFWTAPLE